MAARLRGNMTGPARMWTGSLWRLDTGVFTKMDVLAVLPIVKDMHGLLSDAREGDYTRRIRLMMELNGWSLAEATEHHLDSLAAVSRTGSAGKGNNQSLLQDLRQGDRGREIKVRSIAYTSITWVLGGEGGM